MKQPARNAASISSFGIETAPKALKRNKGLNLAVDASRLAALLVAQMRLAFSLLAPCNPGASTAILNPLFFSSA